MNYDFMNVLVAFPGIALSIAALCSSLILMSMETSQRSYAALPFADNLIFLMSIVMEISFSGKAGVAPHIWMQAANFLQYMALYLFPFCLFLLLDQLYKEQEFKAIPAWILYGIPLAECLLLVVNVYNHMFFRITVDNYYQRGSLFLISQFSAFAGIVVFLYYAIEFYKKTGNKDVRQMLIMTILIVSAAVLQILLPGPNWIAAGTVCCTVFLYSYQLRKWSGMFREKNRELRKNQASLNLSQIDPDSLRVSLAAIADLCREDPTEASHLVDTFADYMRTSFNEMGKEEWNTFDAERHQLFRYLAILQAQYAEEIKVNFQTPVRNFTVPPLILQQVFEKALSLIKDNLSQCSLTLSTTAYEAKEGSGFHLTSDKLQPYSCVVLLIESEISMPQWKPDEVRRIFKDVIVRIDAVQDAGFVIEYPSDKEIQCTLRLVTKPAFTEKTEAAS